MIMVTNKNANSLPLTSL